MSRHSPTPKPTLLTLLRWADQSDLAPPCAEQKLWLASAAEAEEAWRFVLEAKQKLDAAGARSHHSSNGKSPPTVARLPAEELAAYVDERLDEHSSARLEAACLRSIDQLAELLSAVRHERRFSPTQASLPMASAGLHAKLLAMAGGAKPATPVMSVVEPPPIVRPAGPPQAFDVRAHEPTVNRRRRKSTWLATGVAAALVLALVIGWATSPLWLDSSRGQREDIASEIDAERHRIESPPEAPRQSPSENVIDPPDVDVREPIEPTDSPVEKVRDLPPPPPRERPAPPAPPRSYSLAARTRVGLLLAREASDGQWRPAQGTISFDKPVELVSLDESWSEIALDDSLSFVLSGPVEATLERKGEQINVKLRRGRLGVRRLAAGAAIRFSTEDGQTLLRGVDPYANFALYNERRGAGAEVITGALAIDEKTLRPGELATWNDGVLAVGPALSAPDGDANSIWLEPPNDAAIKTWTAHYGGAANRLAVAESFQAELDRLIKSSRDPRRAALYSRWRMAIDDDDDRAARLTAMLGDRRLLVRRAAVSYLVETPPRHASLARLAPMLRTKYGDETTRQVMLSLAAARRGERIAGAEAGQLANLLGHDDLAIREIGASLLLWRTNELFSEARTRPPEFDAAGPVATRAAAQQQWRRSLRAILNRTGG